MFGLLEIANPIHLAVYVGLSGELLLALVSIVILGSETSGSRDHLLLSHAILPTFQNLIHKMYCLRGVSSCGREFSEWH